VSRIPQRLCSQVYAIRDSDIVERHARRIALARSA